MPRHIIFFDVETTPIELPNGSIEQKFKLGWACYYRKGYGRNLEKVEWCNFHTPLEFWAFVYKRLQKKTKMWVLARNLVFDFTICEGWKYLRQVNFKLKFFHDAGTTSIISVKGRFGSIVFLDIMNWFVESLAKTGERIGIPKLKIDFKTCSDEYLNIYCKRDVEIELENFKQLIRFLEANNVARLCYTRGSTAMAAYLLSHYRKTIYIHNNEQAIDLERESYRGGRTECFYLGDLNNETYYVVDVNSLYPFVMRNNSYPVKYLKIYHKPEISTVADLLKDKAVTAKALVETDEPVYAVKRGRTIFPVGKFWVTLTTPELLYALKHKQLLEIQTAVSYDQANIFQSYVDRFYKLRQEFKSAGVAEYEDLCKKMLNSLYGKFGQKADVWEKIGEAPNEKDRVELLFKSGKNGVRQIRYLLGEVFELKGYEESYNSFAAIPAHVSAYGRLWLWKLMKQAGRENYFYCDTDSLVVNGVGLWNLANQIDKARLGSLKVVNTTTKLVIRGLKDYLIGKKLVVKGIRKNAVEIKTGVYKQEQWPSFQGVLRSGKADTYTIKQVTKILNRHYTKGKVSSDGSIAPLVLDAVDGCPSLF